MTKTRSTWWSALALSLPLSLLAGCGETTETPAETPVTTPSTSPAVPPVETKAPETKPDMPPAKSAQEITKSPTPSPDATTKEAAPKVDAPKVDAPKVDAPKNDAPKTDAPKTAAVKFTDEELAAIKKLPANEQDAALAQAVCPASNETLGGMGMPVKVTAEGKTFYLCCKSCKGDVEKDPKAIVAKLARK